MEHQETYTDTVRRVIEVSRILTEIITPEEWAVMGQGDPFVHDRNREGLQKQEWEKNKGRP
jgi:hypothetical protein